MAEPDIQNEREIDTALPLSRASTVVGYGVGKTVVKKSWPLVKFSVDAIYRLISEFIARPSFAALRGLGNLTVGVGIKLPTYLIYNILGRLPYYLVVRPALMLARAALPKKGEAITNLMKGIDDTFRSFKTYWQDTAVYKGWQTAKKHMNVKSLEHFVHDFFDARMEGLYKFGKRLTPNQAMLTLVICFGVLAPLSPAAGLLLHGYSLVWFMPDWLATGAHAAWPMIQAAGIGAFHFGQALWAAPLATIMSTANSGLALLHTALPGLLTTAHTFASNLAAAPAQTLWSLLPSLATAKMVAVEAIKLPLLLTGLILTNAGATFFPKAKTLLPALFAACSEQASKSPFGGRQLAAWLNHTHNLGAIHDLKNDVAFSEKNIVKPWTNYTLLGLSTVAAAVIAPPFALAPLATYLTAKAAQKYVLTPIGQTQTWQNVSGVTQRAASRAGHAILSRLENIPLLGRAVRYTKERTIEVAKDTNVVDKVSGVLAPFVEKSSADYWKRRLSGSEPTAIVSEPVAKKAGPAEQQVAPVEHHATSKSLIHTLLVYGTSATAPLVTVLATQKAFQIDGALSHALSFMVGGHEVAALFSGILAATVGAATFVSTTTLANKLPNWLFRPAAGETTVNREKIDNAKGAIAVEGVVMGGLGLIALSLGAPVPMVIGAVASWILPTLLKGRQQLAEAYSPQRTDIKAPAAKPAASPL